MAVDDKARDVAQKVCLIAERLQHRHRVLAQLRRTGTRAFYAKEIAEGRLAGISVLTDRLAHICLAALNIEKIVGDLKGETNTISVCRQRFTLRAASLSQNSAGRAGEAEQRAGLAGLETSYRIKVERRFSGFRREIHHLATDHAQATRGRCQRLNKLGSYFGLWMAARRRYNLKSER